MSVDASTLPGNKNNPNVLLNAPATSSKAVTPSTTVYASDGTSQNYQGGSYGNSTPAVAPTLPKAPVSATASTTGTAGADAAPSRDSVYNDFLSRNQSVIDSIQDSFDSQITANTNAANLEGAKAEQGAAASAAASGLVGSSAATAGATKTAVDINTGLSKENSAIMTQRAQAVGQAMQQIQDSAESAYEFERQQYDTDVATDQATQAQNMTNATNVVKGLATNHVNFDTFSTDPKYKDSYDNLVKMVGGDPNTLNALWALNTPPANIVKTWTDGGKYYQLVQDPVTGKPQVQSFDLPDGVTIPQDWTFQKVGTNSGRWTSPNYNPSDPSTYKDVYVDPFTGAISDGSAPTASSSDTGDTGPGSAAGSAARNVQSILPANSDGTPADMSQSLSQAVATYGAPAIAQAMVKNEGGSPSGVQNNPGNIKYTGAPGQTDSGVKATDGGTFASYATPEDGNKSVEDIITNAASGKSSAYGASPTLAGFIGTYTNTGTDSSSGGSTPDSAQYGSLASVQGFNPSDPIDSAASNYLNEYLSQGKVPTAASVGVSTRTGSGQIFNTIAARANALYTEATGQALPDFNTLQANKKLINGNNSILNNLNIQEGTISQNADLLINNLNGANINQAAPMINKVIDGVKNSLGDVDTASLYAQSSTIQNELGSLLALKNATGTTVHDKLEAAGLIDSSYNSDQIAQVVKTLMQEAQNGRSALQIANAKLYEQTDPLGKNPQNPLSNPTTFAQSVGLDLDSVRKDYPGLTDAQIVSQYVNSQ